MNKTLISVRDGDVRFQVWKDDVIELDDSFVLYLSADDARQLAKSLLEFAKTLTLGEQNV